MNGDIGLLLNSSIIVAPYEDKVGLSGVRVFKEGGVMVMAVAATLIGCLVGA